MSDSKKTAFVRRRNQIRQAWSLIRRKHLSWIFPSKHLKEMRDYHLKKDPEENLQVSPPDNEHVDVLCYWGLEYYTPNHIEKLISSVRRLGWVDDDRGPNRDVATWLRQARSRTFSGGWTNVGTLKRAGDQDFWGLTRSAPLPAGVRYGQAYLFDLTPSLTCMAIKFVFDDRTKKSYEAILRTSHATILRPTRNGHTILSPRFRKPEEIAKERERLARSVSAWFRKNAPGIFSRSSDFCPTCEFMYLGSQEPFPDDKSDRSRDYLTSLGIRYESNAWKSQDIPGLRFAWPIKAGRSDYHAILAASETTLSAVDMKYCGDDVPGKYLAYFSQYFEEILVRWGTLELVSLMERRLANVRDTTRFSSLHRDPLRIIRELRQATAESVDAASVAPELGRFGKTDRLWGSSWQKFMPVREPFPNEEQWSLQRGILDNLRRRSKALLKADRRIKDLLIQQGSLTSAYENVRLQRWVAVLTVIILVLTAIMAVGPVSDLIRERQQIVDVLRNLPERLR